MARVDAGLAANGTVDLRQKRGRDLHKAHAAAHDTGCKTGKVADHAAAERDHRVIALDTGRQHHVADGCQMIEAFGLLTGRQRQRDSFDTVGLQRIHQGFEIKRGDMFVGDDRSLASLEPRGDLAAGTGQQSRTDQDIVGPVSERHMHKAFGGSGLHCHSVSPCWAGSDWTTPD
ncbi:hypothetical protein D3C71_1011830 [compost metagenome]